MTFDTTPKPFFLQAMRNQSWNVTGAIAELVDNSFGSGRGNARLCEINYNPRKRAMIVIDNGVGIEAIGRLFQLGNTIGHSPGDIGRYGSGGTMAILWLADEVTVFTLRGGKVSADKVMWSESLAKDRFPQINDRWQKASLSNCPAALMAYGHGTAIRMKIAVERGKLNVSNIRRDLAKMYGPGIRAGKQLVWSGPGGESEALTDQVVMPDDPEKIISFDLTIEHGDDFLPVSGQIGMVEELSFTDAGIAVGYGTRVITRTKDCFISPDGNEKFTGASITGWLDLGEGWQPYLTTTKNAINDRPLWDELMGYVFHKIRSILKESEEEKLSIELDDIALGLTDLFNGNAVVTVRRQPAEVPDDLGPGESEEPGEPDPPTMPEADDGPTVDRPARTEIEIFQEDDQTMDGVLCSAEPMGSAILVMVNKDHQLIQLSLRSRPVNRALLTQVVIAEIANVMAKDQELVRMAFKPGAAAEFLAVADDAHRERKILRFMADNVKGKPAA